MTLSGFCIIGRNTKDAVLSSHCILSGGASFSSIPLLTMFTLISWLWWYLLGFSTMRLFFSLLQLLSIMWRGTLQLCQYLVLHDIFKLFLYWFRSIWTHGFLFYVMCLNPLLSLLISIPNCPWLGQWDIVLWALPYFLAYDVPGSPCTVSTPALGSAISPRCPVSLDSLAESLVENGI